MRKVLWTALATRDRQQALGHANGSAEIDESAMDAWLAQHLAVLIQHPQLGRLGSLPGTRELVLERRYVLVYETWRDAIVILRLLHSRQRWPPPSSGD